ncbi:MAG: hypothetical protein IJU37_04980 [Desulfovibrio sp.]|nr:hypothetical protein [Desulfovibrio sp.]
MESNAKLRNESVRVAVEDLAVPEIIFPNEGETPTDADAMPPDETINYRCAVPEVHVERKQNNPAH